MGRFVLRPYMFYGGELPCAEERKFTTEYAENTEWEPIRRDKAHSSALFVAEGDDWVYAGGADCGNGAGGYGDAEQDYRDGEEGAPVAGCYAVEQ